MGYNQAFASFTGPGRSPWDPARWSGGSSSGSGAAVGAGLVPFAIGSETWGSIQYPAAFCGVTGLRPTYGRVSRHGAMALSWTMDKLGPLARTAEDCGTVLAAAAGPDPADPSALGRGFAYRAGARSRKRYRLGILRGTLEKTQPEVRRNFEESLRVLREFADIEEELELPDFPYEAMASIVIDAEAASAFEPLFESGRITGADRAGGPDRRVRRPGRAGEGLPPCPPAAAPGGRGSRPAARPGGRAGRADASDGGVADRRGLRQGVPRLLGRGEYQWSANLCGVPGLFLMNGTGEGGLPTSLQLTGRALGEDSLLAIGHRYQQRTKFHRLRPPGL